MSPRSRALLALALALASAPTRAANATPTGDVATLRSYGSQVACAGERYWSGRGKRTFWTQGGPCALTYEQCLIGYVTDADGLHKVTGCSTDDKNSRGRKADYE